MLDVECELLEMAEGLERPHEGVEVEGGDVGIQQFFSLCHCHEDGQDEPLGGLGGLL